MLILEQNKKLVDTLSPSLLASLIVAFFNYLPEALVEDRLYNMLVIVAEITDKKWRQNLMHSILIQLPTQNRTVLKFVLNKLAKIISYDSSVPNSDILDNLSKFIGPALLARKSKSILNRNASLNFRNRSKTLESIGSIPKSDKMNSFSKWNSAQTLEKNDKIDFSLPKKARKIKRTPVEGVEVSASDRSQAQNVFKRLIADNEIVFQVDLDDIKYVNADGNLVISCGAINKIMEKLVDDHYPEADFQDIFFMTYDYFMTSLEVLQNLRDLYNAEDVNQLQFWQHDKRLRILFLIKVWIVERIHFLKTDKKFKSLLFKFVKEDKHQQKEQAMLQAIWNRFKSDLEISDGPLEKKPFDVALIRAIDQILIDIPVNKLAHQLALHDQMLFKRITTEECLRGTWQDRTKAPCFAAITDQFNNFVLWLQGKIITQDDLTKRREYIVKFADLGIESVEIGNFNSAMAVHIAINSIAVSRLKNVFKDLPRKTLKQLEDLKVLFDFQKNYNTYRTKLLAASPAVPYLGIITKDLFALEENNPTYVYKKLINWEKLRQLYTHIKLIKKWQKASYVFEKDEETLTFLSNLPLNYTEDELYSLSLKIEPQHVQN